MAVPASERRRVREHADSRCEYCRMAEAWEPFFIYHVEHIVARQHRGGDEPGNLAFACNHCNLLKGPNLTSIEPDTGSTTPLYHPAHSNGMSISDRKTAEFSDSRQQDAPRFFSCK